MQILNKKFDEKFEKLLEGGTETVDSALVSKLHKRFLRETIEAADKCMEDFADFKYANEEAIENNFHQENALQTSIRGVKIRGTYNTLREAQIRAKVLQRMDPSFHIFVGQVGYWLPWDPTADKIENQEYANKELNEIVKKYKTNESKRDMFYEEQKRERKQTKLQQELENQARRKEAQAMIITGDDENKKPTLKAAVDQALEEVTETMDCSGNSVASAADCQESCNDTRCKEEKEDHRHLEELMSDAKSKLAMGCDGDDVIEMDEAVDRLNGMDPWMSRKLGELTLNDSADSYEDDLHAPLEEAE
jgi:hypothetical protein